MEHFLKKGWQITPAGGATGEAFFAKHGEDKLFLKRNSSPFLAVLSAEGIVPKLIWTKRMENGDVITAQKWLEGRELQQSEMEGAEVAKLLRKIHQSDAMLNMLVRLGKRPLYPELILNHLQKDTAAEIKEISSVQRAFQFLASELDNLEIEQLAVCHCDVNHNNWLLSEDDQLFLIDWDGAMIADPAIDLGPLLYFYIKEASWGDWLETYGLVLSQSLELRMNWYVLAQVIYFINWHRSKSRFDEMELWIHYLEKLMAN